jgi:RNA polymerase sigma-70 factor (ECF subfamily)
MIPIEDKRDDPTLVKQALKGDSSAYSTLYDRHKLRLKNQMWKFAGEEAEEAAHAGLTQAFLSLKQFKGNSQFSTWLYRVTFNSFLMSKRSKSVPIAYSLDAPASDIESASNLYSRRYPTFPIRDLSLEGIIDRQTLVKCLESLPSGQRRTFILHAIEGYHHQEIAEMLGCAIGSSKSQLNKAKMKLQEELLKRPRFSHFSKFRPPSPSQSPSLS